MKTLLRDFRVRRLLVANLTGSVGSGVTIIAVPWLLIHRDHGDQLYGWATVGTTIVLFLLMPYYGAWLDRHSRKTMLLAAEIFGLLATLTMALWALLTGHIETWQLVTSYFCGMLYYTLQYPAKFAFLQQVFTREQYQPLSGLLEIQGQTAMMIAGGLGSVLIDRVPLPTILLLDAATYLFSFLVQSTLPYEPTHLAPGGRGPAASAWAAMAEGWRWLSERPRVSVFFACTLVPFILVMVSNYLFPIYVSGTLHAPAAVFGRGEIAFAIGAAFAGAIVPPLARRFSGQAAILFGMLVCATSLAALVAFPAQCMFYVGLLLFGFSNAAVRVARTALMFLAVPNVVMGRVSMFYNVFDRVLRTALTFVATLLVAQANPTAGFVLLLAVLALAFGGTLWARAAVRRTTLAPVAA